MITLTAEIVLSDGTKETIDKRNILSLESEIRDRADIDKPSFGLISSGGRLSFRDDNSRFLGYAENGILKGNELITIFLNNTLSKTREQVGKYFATDWDYDDDNKSASVSFEDGLEEWQEISVEQYDFREISPLYLYSIYDHLKEVSNEKENVFNLGKEEENFLKEFLVEYPNLSSGNLWEHWRKLCQVCGFVLYKNKDGSIFFKKSFMG